MASVIILDGGMGRELARRGASFRQPEWSALALTEAPDVVRQTHLDFIRAGARVITTNSYAVVPFHIGARFEREGVALATTAGRLAREAVIASGEVVRVAASLPPLFGSYRPDLFDATRAPDIAQVLIDGQANYADIWLAETVSSIAEAQFWQTQLPQDGKPFWVSFTLEDTQVHDEARLRSGETVQAAVEAMMRLPVQAILFNCSCPEVMEQAVITAHAILSQHQPKCHLGVYANAFEAEEEGMSAANEGLSALRQDTTPAHYVTWAQRWVAAGADIVGGCCGIGPEHIKQLAQTWSEDVAC